MRPLVSKIQRRLILSMCRQVILKILLKKRLDKSYSFLPFERACLCHPRSLICAGAAAEQPRAQTANKDGKKREKRVGLGVKANESEGEVFLAENALA